MIDVMGRCKRYALKTFCLFSAITGLCLLTLITSAQNPVTENEQQLEQLTAANNDAEVEDDSGIQQLEYYRKHPLNLNKANKEDLLLLGMLNALQVNAFLQYRKWLGVLIDLHELQAVPGWDAVLIKTMLPYVTITESIPVKDLLQSRLTKGESSVLVRLAAVLPLSKGFQTDSNLTASHYEGSPLKMMFRYACQYNQSLYYGLLGDKDAGESFFKGRQKGGFDFYSAHLFIRDIGTVKALALGDFTVNLGQGLIQWHNMAFKKSAAVLNIKREAPVINPYRSPGEIYFFRGGGVTLGKKQWSTTLFFSDKKVDGNLVHDTLQNGEDYFTALQTSGYHRTLAETDDKGALRLISTGANLTFKQEHFQIGLNVINHYFNKPLVETVQPYNRYSLNGTSFFNSSLDYSFTVSNFHSFGEIASDQSKHIAFVHGLLVSVHADADLSILYRNISSAYQSLYSNAFTEASSPSNEKGLYMGLSVHPGHTWRVDAYADWFSFAWLKYGVNAPSNGTEYLLQLGFTPSRRLTMTSRYKAESKAENDNTDLQPIKPIKQVLKQTWRNDLSCSVNSNISVSIRTELLWLTGGGGVTEHGYLTFLGCNFKPQHQPFSFSGRLAYFETDSYDSRIYAYENDILYSFSIPAFYGHGLRYYINLNYDFNKRIKFWAKYAQLVYPGKTLIGSGLETIQGSKKGEFKLELLYKF